MNDLIVKTMHGSHLYGTSRPESDVDYKGLFVNTSFRDLILGNRTTHINKSTGSDFSKNTAEDVDLELFELKRFIDEACKGEMIALDMIHTPDDLIVEKGRYFHIWQFIRENRHRFYSKNMKAYLGYARKQAAKYGIKGSRMGALQELVEIINTIWNRPTGISTPRNLMEFVESDGDKTALPINEFCFYVTNKIEGRPDQCFYEVLGSKYQLTMPYEEFYNSIMKKWNQYGERARAAKDNNGIDWKAVSHAFRACYQISEIFQTGDLNYPLENAEELLAIKNGNIEWSIVQPALEAAIDELEQDALLSHLPEKVDKEWWYDRVVDWYEEIML